MRGRKKGTFKTGGREKGTENKINSYIKNLIGECIQNNIGTMQTDYETLEPKDRLLFIEKLLKYAIPTKIENESVDVEKQIIVFSEQKTYDYPKEENTNMKLAINKN